MITTIKYNYIDMSHSSLLLVCKTERSKGYHVSESVDYDHDHVQYGFYNILMLR